MTNGSEMTFSEVKSTAILALIFASRMLGLFMVIPILALYTGVIAGATPILIGVAAGIYGLTQALFQIPCGLLSDRLGRKPVIAGGLLLFIIGSLVAAFCHSIEGLILGRALQGVGAVGSAILALVADTTREQVRTRAMALIGISIGFTFVLAFLLGPLLDAYIGLSGIFLLTALLASAGVLLLCKIPSEAKPVSTVLPGQFRALIRHSDLWRLNLNIFILHAVLTASFLVFPHKIQEVTGLASQQVWRFYLPVLVASVILMSPLLRYADKPKWQKKLMKAAMLGLGMAVLLLLSATSQQIFFAAATLFFIAFNFLEASLPALVSRMVPRESKGGALGVYSFSQFLGMFVGGMLGGCIQQWMGPWGIGISCLILVVIGCLTLSTKMRNEIWQEA